jgi:hypothetical protein
MDIEDAASAAAAWSCDDDVGLSTINTKTSVHRNGNRFAAYSPAGKTRMRP